ncbi:MAG TPA: YHS domain-containing protein [Gammaproteobacteria bacterium]|nr:YHS domain-containing protein [Gammaproteobacteria bacterium]
MSALSDICPVCGMKTAPEVAAIEYHKMFFHFCSEQCRKMFLDHPALYSGKIGKEQSKILKRRTMSLAEPVDDEIRKRIISSLMKMMGVQEVTAEKGKVSVTYDLRQVTEGRIEEVLAEVGTKLGGGWLDRLRRGWVHESEETELDNLAAPPAPKRNRPPPGV